LLELFKFANWRKRFDRHSLFWLARFNFSIFLSFLATRLVPGSLAALQGSDVVLHNPLLEFEWEAAQSAFLLEAVFVEGFSQLIDWDDLDLVHVKGPLKVEPENPLFLATSLSAGPTLHSLVGFLLFQPSAVEI
jgi:hypothetical protein